MKNDENNNVNNFRKLNKIYFKPKNLQFKNLQDSLPQPCQYNTEIINDVNSERVRDWVWFSWSNLNFSFRKIWNRCKLSREESDMQHNSLSLNPISNADPMLWLQFSSIPHSFQY